MFSFVLENVAKGPICIIELDAQKVQQFSDAIESSYWFELFIGMEMLILFRSDAHFFIVPFFWHSFHPKFVPFLAVVKSPRWSAIVG